MLLEQSLYIAGQWVFFFSTSHKFVVQHPTVRHDLRHRATRLCGLAGFGICRIDETMTETLLPNPTGLNKQHGR